MLPLLGRAQTPDTIRTPPPMKTVALDSVGVMPSAIDTKGWLLLDKDIQLELDGAVTTSTISSTTRPKSNSARCGGATPTTPCPTSCWA